MLILAGVSISAIVGEDGILTKAMMASKQQKIAADLESLNMELTGLNTDLIVGNKDNFTTDEIVGYLVNANVLDDAKRSESGNILGGIDMATGEKFFFGLKGENTYKINIGRDGVLSASNSSTANGGEVTGGTVIVSNKDFNTDSENEEDKGKFTITSDSEVLFMDIISGDLSIYVQSGVHAKVGIYADMTLTNQNISRSAIDIETGGILDLYIAKDVTVIVNSGIGAQGGRAYWPDEDRYASHGAYAGIHVPRYDEESIDTIGWYAGWNGEKITQINKIGVATLNLSGEGVIYCYGGDAGDGGNGIAEPEDPRNGRYDLSGATGGGGAAAGIGGNGGYGGIPEFREYRADWKNGYCYGGSGQAGEDCGNVNISGNIKVYAYGGSRR